MIALLDTGFLFAAAFQQDQHHTKAATAMRHMKGRRLVVAPVVIESFFVAATRLSYDRAVRMFELLQTPAFEILDLTAGDMVRMREIMRQYRDAELDIADVAQMAVAERLNITRIYTFDRRDFGMVIPKHTSHFELLPN